MIRVIAAGALLYNWRAEVESDVSRVVKYWNGFGVDLLVKSKDGSVDAGGSLSAVSVVVECEDTVRIGVEELVVDGYTQL